MATEGQSGTKTPDQLHMELSKAMREGDALAIDRLMNEPMNEEVEEVPEPVAPPAEEPATPEEVPEPTDPVQPEPPVNWEDSLTDEAKEKVRALKEERDRADQRIKSELGRVPNLQRELAELKRKLQEPQRQPAPPAPTPAAPKQNKFAEKLAQVKEIDPVLADLLEETLAAVKEEIAPLREDLGNEIKEVRNVFRDREEQESWRSEKAKLLEAIPQADDIFGLPLYQEWKAGLTPAMAALATSNKADDVIEAIEAFGRYVTKHHPELLPPATQPTATTPAPPVNTQAAKVIEQRQQRLQARQPAPAATPPRPGDGIPDDPEELHRYFVKKIRAGEL